MMHQITSQLLKDEPIHCVNGPWWFLQLWLNLHMHKIVKPDIRDLSYPSSNFAEDYKGAEGRTRGCLTYCEAASAISIPLGTGHFFKKFYRGFDPAILT